MAKVRDVTLAITRGGDRNDRATVSGNVEFSAGEIRLGLSYEMHIFLVEVDDELDQFTLITNGFLGNISHIGFFIGERSTDVAPRLNPRGDSDEAIDYHAGIVLTPPASGMLPFTESFSITPSNRETGNEEYQAVVWVVPEVFMGVRRTNKVSINLG